MSTDPYVIRLEADNRRLRKRREHAVAVLRDAREEVERSSVALRLAHQRSHDLSARVDMLEGSARVAGLLMQDPDAPSAAIQDAGRMLVEIATPEAPTIGQEQRR